MKLVSYDEYSFPHNKNLDIENFKVTGKRKNRWNNIIIETRR